VPTKLEIKLPGGGVLSSMPITTGQASTPLNHVQSLFTQLAPILAILKPFLKVVDGFVAVKDALFSITDVIQGDFTTFNEALGRIFEAVATLATTVPEVSVPIMIKDLVGNLKIALAVLDETLDQVVALADDIDDMVEAAAQVPVELKADVEAEIECFQKQADAQLAHALDALGPVGDVLTLAQSLVEMAPMLPGLPSLGDVTGKSAAQVKEVIGELRAALEALPI
jgi:hypothetical protein